MLFEFGNHFGWVGIEPRSDFAQILLARPFRKDCGTEKGVHHSFDFGCLGRAACVEFVERRETRIVDGAELPLANGAKQFELRTEVVVGCRKAHPGRLGQRAHRSRRKSALGEKNFPGCEQAFARARSSPALIGAIDPGRGLVRIHIHCRLPANAPAASWRRSNQEIRTVVWNDRLSPFCLWRPRPAREFSSNSTICFY